MEKVLFQRIMTENINTFLTTKGESRIGNFNSETAIKDKTISEVEAEVKKENIHNIIENAFTNTHTPKNIKVATIYQVIIHKIQKISETFIIQNLENLQSWTKYCRLYPKIYL